MRVLFDPVPIPGDLEAGDHPSSSPLSPWLLVREARRTSLLK
jgi:hypothetical protein